MKTIEKNRFKKIVIKMAKEVYKSQKKLCNMGFLKTKTDIFIVPLHFSCQEEKQVVFDALRKYCLDISAEAGVFLFNASSIKYTGEGEMIEDMRDGVSFIYEDKDKSMSMWGILKKDRLVTGKWIDIEQDGIYSNIIRKHIEGYV